GYAVAGVVGGLLSSTSVTLTFARLSRDEPSLGRALAAGAVGATAVQVPRVLLAAAVLSPAVAVSLWPLLLPPALAGLLVFLVGLRGPTADATTLTDANPLQLRAALQMTAFFQLVLFAVWGATRWFGDSGLYGSAAVLGLGDVDALTISMAAASRQGTAEAAVAATAIGIGVLSNTAVKLGIATVVGRGHFRLMTGAGLALMGVALAAALAWVGR
ncbi:MAG TPA: DUF4010 domain-containing protein, partial [Vicinamibacterales bacterium]|nr:DUF4010 domain-containing protein [Vicinamibacterales bacterium]